MQIEAFLRRHPQMKRLPVHADEVGQLGECVNAQGDVRTLPCHLRADDPRQSGLDGFFAARLVKA
jgi:16S rRNA (cytosine967-C5)-methyltransferase